jgi:hypothetical protein
VEVRIAVIVDVAVLSDVVEIKVVGTSTEVWPVVSSRNVCYGKRSSSQIWASNRIDKENVPFFAYIKIVISLISIVMRILYIKISKHNIGSAMNELRSFSSLFLSK